MTKGTKSTKTASKAPKVNKPVESNTKEEKSSTEKINQNKSSQENLMRAKQNLTLNIRWLWLVISILPVSRSLITSLVFTIPPLERLISLASFLNFLR